MMKMKKYVLTIVALAFIVADTSIRPILVDTVRSHRTLMATAPATALVHVPTLSYLPLTSHRPRMEKARLVSLKTLAEVGAGDVQAPGMPWALVKTQSTLVDI